MSRQAGNPYSKGIPARTNLPRTGALHRIYPPPQLPAARIALCIIT